MATADQITLIIEGLPEEDGQLRFGVFMSQLQRFSATIARLDREANNGKPAVYYRLAELSYSSPARVVIEPHPLPEQPENAGFAVIQSLERVAATLANGADLSGLDFDLLEDIRALARPVGRSVKETTLIFNGHSLDLTPRIATKIDHALVVEDECEGAIEGMLEQINIHEDANTFHIYPVVGPRKVTCKFPTSLYDDAVSSVGKKVEVSGTLRYRIGANYPHQIAVSAIEAFPPESETPDWEDLRGRAPEATGALSSEAFVRELRSAWR